MNLDRLKARGLALLMAPFMLLAVICWPLTLLLARVGLLVRPSVGLARSLKAWAWLLFGGA